MGRILEYVVLLSSLTLVLGVQQYREASQGSNHEREKQGNLTQVVRHHFPKEGNDVFGKKVLPLDLPPPLRRMLSPPKANQMRSSLGLRAFASENTEWQTRRRNHSEPNTRHFPRRNSLPPYSHSLYPRKNSKTSIYHGETHSQRLSGLEDFSRRYHKEGRNARHHTRYSPKACDPCNSVPWIPLLKVPDSYRQQRTHVTELHHVPQQNFNLDYHGFATDTHNVFLPPVPLVPPHEGTISSSFGLPLGNIPTGHGLLAPINPLATAATHGIDYSSSFNFFSPPGLLETHSFPELSPIPIVPIHDSGRFYQFDSGTPDLVPPPSQNIDVSKVVLTISEDNTHDLQPPKPPPKPESSPPPKDQTIDFGKLEIVKSIPLAEFTSSVSTTSTDLPLYPPLQSDYSTGFGSKTEVTDHPKLATDVSHPPKTSHPPSKSEPQGEHSAPRPLTSPSLSWLFSDHTAPPSDSKAAAASVSSFVTQPREIASAVNNELRPVSPHPLTISPPNKSKKIQIIIPYTTKNKNDRDNNVLESVRHEVFRPPGSGVESESSRDFAYSPTTPLPPEGEEVVGTELKTGEHKSRKYISEMHHIIASNIRELLKEEIEKSKKEQNYPLQNNIDNWTALEYSNHKTLETKAPKEIITQALAVTSIPGTSISHLLLPSKKIPDEYFVTTPSQAYDEPTTATYKATNSTVNSSPFTAKPYATTSIYTPARAFGESEKPPASNHGTIYSEVGRGRVNSWGKLNENLVLPEARSKTGRKELPTTRSGSPFRLPGTEKLEIVTPVPLTTQRNYTTIAFRRTTREAVRTEETTTALGRTAETTTAFGRTAETTTALGRTVETTTALRRTTEETTTETPRPAFLSRLNSTRLERVSNRSAPFSRKFVYSTTTDQIRNSSRTSGSVTVLPISARRNETTEATKPTGSINDVFPFRNKELPWQTNLNSSDSAYRAKGERKSLIKQVNLQRARTVAASS